jgi:hypothetical protein
LYFLDDLSEDSFVNYAALAELENGRWMVIFSIEEEDKRLELIEPTLGKAKAALDQLLGAGNPELPADRDAADPWFGDDAEHQKILWWMRHSEEYAQQLWTEVNADLRDSSSPPNET